jgi:hypothetical protein
LSVPSICGAGAAGAGAGAGVQPPASSETNSAERNLMNPASLKTPEVYLLQQACRKTNMLCI